MDNGRANSIEIDNALDERTMLYHLQSRWLPDSDASVTKNNLYGPRAAYCAHPLTVQPCRAAPKARENGPERLPEVFTSGAQFCWLGDQF